MVISCYFYDWPSLYCIACEEVKREGKEEKEENDFFSFLFGCID
jgi:hypothetical protein